MKNKYFLFLPLVALTVTSCQTGVRHKTNEYVLSKTLEYHENFRILQLTDLHIGDKDYQDIHYKFLDLTIQDAKKDADIDLIVITGDLFTMAGKGTVRRMINFFNSYKIPWTLTFGNHDEQCYFSVDWLTNEFNNAGQYCYFKDIQDDDITGNSNFAINLTSGGNVVQQVIVMDSNRYVYGEYTGYDYFKKDQIEWYKRLTDAYPVPSLMFYHIPLPEINDAWAKRNSDPTGEQFEYVTGKKDEKSCPPDYNSGFFDVIKERGLTKGMFFGHDHLNDFVVKYEGVYFGYGIKSTDRVYYDESMLGGRVITIKPGNTLEFQDFRHTYKEVM